MRKYGIGLAVAIIGGGLAISVAPAQAATCPVVDPVTFAVTPAPSAGVDWSGCDLAGANLQAATLTGADLSGTDLTGADLFKAALDTASLANATVTNADLGRASVTGASLDGATFSGAEFLGANLSGSSVGGAVLGNAILGGVLSGGLTGTPASLPQDWSVVKGYLIGQATDLTGADLSGANLSGADLEFAELASANLAGANLAGADFSKADLGNVSSGGLTGTPAVLPAHWQILGGYLIGPATNLAGANLTSVNLSGADLSMANAVGADLAGANLTQAILGGAILTNANLTGADLMLAGLGDATLTGAKLNRAILGSAVLQGTNLTDANLTRASLNSAAMQNANLTGANLTKADLRGVDDTGANFSSVTWSDTTCPNGTNSDKFIAGCFSARDTQPPAASPAVTAGTPGLAGWYTSTVTVSWHWTDNGTIDKARCTSASSTARQGAVTLSTSCADIAGNMATASFPLMVDTEPPAVKVTGVVNRHQYVLGKVPAAGCATTDTASGVAAPAGVTVTTTGTGGVGTFTVTCAGASDLAGNQAPARVARYTVVYGFGGFGGPKPGSTLQASAHSIAVTFRLTDAAGEPIPAATASALAAAGSVQARLSGPGIKAVSASCGWDAAAGLFRCLITTPAKLRAGAGQDYRITALEAPGTGLTKAPATGRAADPETIHFR